MVSRQNVTASPADEAPIPDLAGVEEGRPKRADARRNRERLQSAARIVFARDGGEASMEAIAREAGVGVGTLYRHFPRRIDLVEAVYLDEVEELTRTADRVVTELEPWPAMVAFLQAFVRYAQGKRTILNELQEAFEKHPDLRSDCRERIEQAMQIVVERGQRAGVVRTDIAGSDLFQLLAPMCANSTLLEDQSGRLLAVILDGLRASS